MQRTEKTTVASLRAWKQARRKFSVLTCYDAATAHLMQDAGVEVLLVGDTAAEVVLGLATTREIPLDFLLTLTAAVRRGAPEVLVMGDLPFACRKGSNSDAIEGAQRFVDAGADVVKVEVTSGDVGLVEEMTRAGVSVVAHLGLLPQQLGPNEGYTARGRTAEQARELLLDAKRFEQAGAVGLLLEAVASEVAREIATHTALPVIGCVAGPYCDGTVVVLHDMIGWGGGHPPRTVRRYGDLAEVMIGAFRRYVADIHSGDFPSHKESIHMRTGEFEKLMANEVKSQA